MIAKEHPGVHDRAVKLSARHRPRREGVPTLASFHAAASRTETNALRLR